MYIALKIEKMDNGYTVVSNVDGYRDEKKSIHASLADALNAVIALVDVAPKVFQPVALIESGETKDEVPF